MIDHKLITQEYEGKIICALCTVDKEDGRVYVTYSVACSQGEVPPLFFKGMNKPHVNIFNSISKWCAKKGYTLWSY